ncbi:MAG: hypothetical protein R2788_19485 [Saprospiraceae bacterium]
MSSEQFGVFGHQNIFTVFPERVVLVDSKAASAPCSQINENADHQPSVGKKANEYEDDGHDLTHSPQLSGVSTVEILPVIKPKIRPPSMGNAGERD